MRKREGTGRQWRPTANRSWCLGLILDQIPIPGRGLKLTERPSHLGLRSGVSISLQQDTGPLGKICKEPQERTLRGSLRTMVWSQGSPVGRSTSREERRWSLRFLLARTTNTARQRSNSRTGQKPHNPLVDVSLHGRSQGLTGHYWIQDDLITTGNQRFHHSLEV